MPALGYNVEMTRPSQAHAKNAHPCQGSLKAAGGALGPCIFAMIPRPAMSFYPKLGLIPNQDPQDLHDV